MTCSYCAIAHADGMLAMRILTIEEIERQIEIVSDMSAKGYDDEQVHMLNEILDWLKTGW